MILRVDHVSKSYSGVKILDDISLKIKKGEIVGLLGRNGAGKSTLMKIITGFITPTQGNVFFNDQPLTKEQQSKKTFDYDYSTKIPGINTIFVESILQ